MSLWTVDYNDEVPGQIEAMLRSGDLDGDDYVTIRTWIQQVKIHGPHSLRKTQRLSDYSGRVVEDEILQRVPSEVNLWNDHDLKASWRGYRSSSFSRLGRIIYCIENEGLRVVRVEKITPDHQY